MEAEKKELDNKDVDYFIDRLVGIMMMQVEMEELETEKLMSSQNE